MHDAFTTDGAKLITTDKSCTVPAIPATGVDFRNAAYTGTTSVSTGNDGAGAGLDRTREGYMEIIDMGVVTNTIITGYIKHNSAGVPANCVALDAYDGLSATAPTTAGAAGRFAQTGGHLTSPVGGLFGRASLINSANGTNYDLEPTALDGWWAPQLQAPQHTSHRAI